MWRPGALAPLFLFFSPGRDKSISAVRNGGIRPKGDIDDALPAYGRQGAPPCDFFSASALLSAIIDLLRWEDCRAGLAFVCSVDSAVSLAKESVCIREIRG